MPAKPLNEKTKKALKEKAEGTRFTYGELAQVYRRGQGAYLSSGSRNVSMAAWATRFACLKCRTICSLVGDSIVLFSDSLLTILAVLLPGL